MPNVLPYLSYILLKIIAKIRFFSISMFYFFLRDKNLYQNLYLLLYKTCILALNGIVTETSMLIFLILLSLSVVSGWHQAANC